MDQAVAPIEVGSLPIFLPFIYQQMTKDAWKKLTNLLPNGGFLVIYHGTRVKKSHLKQNTSKSETGTLPATNIAPENGWLDYQFPFGMSYFQVLR